ncbi:putative isopenicillin N synthase [Helianthus anomalus]
MASSTQDHHHQHFPTSIATTSAPPPTPSTTTNTSTSTSSATDLLSRLLHRLPPSLSTTTGTTPLLLRRRSSLSTTTSPPTIPFTDLTSTLSSTLPTISELGYFQLTNHPIPSELARSAESDSATIFNLSSHQKHQHFPTTWPLGFDDDDDDDDETQHSLLLDLACSTESSSELGLSSLREFTREMEKVGLAVVDALTCAVGLRNPGLDDPDSVSTLMWISESCSDFGGKMCGSGRFYPYVVGLHYQIRSRSCSLLTDSGLVSVLPEMDSILITLGDIAQVWSNGKLKKVRGKPTLSMEEGSDASSLSMSLLVTLPLESTVSPLIPRALISNNSGTDDQEDENKDVHEEFSEVRLFSSFSFEDYAWRVYHERVPLKDPLDRYRNKL